jgi:hypothetical protein
VPIAPETIQHYLTELPQRCSVDAALELFDALGYQYPMSFLSPLECVNDYETTRPRI